MNRQDYIMKSIEALKEILQQYPTRADVINQRIKELNEQAGLQEDTGPSGQGRDNI
jgi:hypothetical protein